MSTENAVQSLKTMSGAEIAVGLSAGKLPLADVVAHLSSRLLPAEGQAAVYGALAANPAVMQAVILSQAALASKGKSDGSDKKTRRTMWRAAGKRNVSILPPKETGGWTLTSTPAGWKFIIENLDSLKAALAECETVSADTLAAEILAKGGSAE